MSRENLSSPRVVAFGAESMAMYGHARERGVRPEKLSRANFAIFGVSDGGISHFRTLEKSKNPLFSPRKGAIPTNGNFAPRIVGTMSQNASGPCVLYYLADPRFPRWPRYVGMTANTESRLKRHYGGSPYNDLLGAWRRELRANGLWPVMHVLAAYPSRAEAREAEWRLMRRWRRRGLCDCNTARDGAWDATKLEWSARHTRAQERAYAND